MKVGLQLAVTALSKLQFLQHFSGKLKACLWYESPIKKVQLYIQTKGTLNPTKEHMTNDGSRIMNFVGSSLSEACQSQDAYYMRLILFTLGKGLHFRLDENTGKKIEVVNYSEISRKIDKNPFFWNHIRRRLGLPTIDIARPTDPEGTAIKMELDELDI